MISQKRVASLLALVAVVVVLLAVENVRKDDLVYKQMGHLKGQITIANHPTLGRTPGAGHYLVFKRIDCDRCAIGTRADLQGRYELFLSAGRYRVISTASVTEGEGPDLIKPPQATKSLLSLLQMRLCLIWHCRCLRRRGEDPLTFTNARNDQIYVVASARRR